MQRFRFLAATLVAATLAAAPCLAQEPPPVPVLVLGTVHLSNPGRDYANPEVDDPRSERRQREIAAIVEGLARFAPTKIAVERTPEREARTNERYRAWLAGEIELGVSETEQIGFRLARRLGHDRLFGVDHDLGLDVEGVLEWGASHGYGDRVASIQATIGEAIGRIQETIESGTFVDLFRLANDPAWDRRSHALYMEAAGLLSDAEHPGPDMVADWYERNLRIHANVTRVSEPGDRLVVIFGAGHGYLLRHYFEASPRFENVDVLPYLDVEPAGD